MKILFFALLISGSAFAQDLQRTCPTRDFDGYHQGSMLGDRCDMEIADYRAETKCKRARDNAGNGYNNCRRLPGMRGARVEDGGSGQLCIVTYRGTLDC
jgi:hypothetical protein